VTPRFGGIHPMKLKNVLRRIHPNSANLFHGRSPLFEICNDLILAHTMPSGAVHPNIGAAGPPVSRRCPAQLRQFLRPQQGQLSGAGITTRSRGRWSHNLNAVITDVTPGLTEDVVGHFAKSLVGAGHRITLDHLCVVADAFVADSKKAAIAEYSPSYLHFTQTLWHHRTGAGFRPHQRE
jgi:hypothetical protein